MGLEQQDHTVSFLQNGLCICKCSEQTSSIMEIRRAPSTVSTQGLNQLDRPGFKSCLGHYHQCNAEQVTTLLVLRFLISKKEIVCLPPKATGKRKRSSACKVPSTMPATQQALNKIIYINGLSALFLCLPPSIVMTTCSTFFALGMMPLLLYVYSRGIYEGDLKDKVPYGGIVISLILVLIPCTIGIFLNAKRPQYARYMVKVRNWGPGHGARTPPSSQGMAQGKSFGLFQCPFPCLFKGKKVYHWNTTSCNCNVHENT